MKFSFKSFPNDFLKPFRFNYLKSLIVVFFLQFLHYNSSGLVYIFEIYAGSRQTGAIYNDDYMVLYNSGPGAQSLSGWSVQFATSGSDSWAKFNLPNYTMPASTFYLIRIPVFGTNQPNTAPIANPDFNAPLFRFNGLDNSGKLVLMSTTNLIPTGVFDPNGLADLIDFVGFGGADFSEGNLGNAPSPAPNGPIWRPNNTDTNNNFNDFRFEPEPLNGAFPVKLVRFEAKQTFGKITLEWETSIEINNMGFEIERSSDAVNFKSLGFLPSAHPSSENTLYQYEDGSPLPGQNYYRLKQKDWSGDFTFSKIIAIDFINNLKLKVFPNPAYDYLILEESFAKNISDFAIIDLKGNEISKPGIIENRIDISEIKSEIIFLRFVTKTGVEVTTKIKKAF